MAKFLWLTLAGEVRYDVFVNVNDISSMRLMDDTTSIKMKSGEIIEVTETLEEQIWDTFHENELILHAEKLPR